MKTRIVSKKAVCMFIVFAVLIITFHPAYSASKDKEVEKIKKVWTSFVERLSMKDIDGALEYIVEDRRGNYREAFTFMKDKIAEEMSKKEEIQINEVDENMAKGENIVRENGGVYSYPVIFIKERGQWKIQSF